MTLRMARAGGTSLGLSIFTWAGLVGAAVPPPAPVERGYSLEYRAAAGCPEASALAQAIEARTPGALQEPRDRAGVQLRVELREDGTSTLWVDLPEGSSRREFPAVACADALASIAVIASMVLEADASERVATTQSVMDRVEPAAAPVAASAPAAPAKSPRAEPATRAPSPPPPASVKRDARPSSKAARLRLALSGGALLESAVAKGAAVGASAGIAAWREPALPSVWVPQVRAELLATLPATVHASQGAVELGLVAGRLHVCPLRLPVAGSLTLVPCLSGDIGSLRARGTADTLHPRSRTMTWLALGGTARAEVALGRWVSLESWLGLRGLGRADTFVFKPDFPAYQVPRWSLGAGLGVTARLP